MGDAAASIWLKATLWLRLPSASPTVLGYWCGILLLRFEPKLSLCPVRIGRCRPYPNCAQLKIAIPLIQYIGLALKAELAIDGCRRSRGKALAVHLLRHYSTRKREIRTYSGCLPSHKLQQALDYIQAHLEDVSLEAITTELGMVSLCRLFKQSTGYSPTNMWLNAGLNVLKN